MSTIFYAQTKGELSTNSATPVDLPGLAVTIPGWSLRSNEALVTVNIPNPYATGQDFPGGVFIVAVNGTIQDYPASFTYSNKTPESFCRVPLTLMTKVTLPQSAQAATIQVKWNGVRGSTVKLDSPASLSVQLF
jgi:hypothetical protein